MGFITTASLLNTHPTLLGHPQVVLQFDRRWDRLKVINTGPSSMLFNRNEEEIRPGKAYDHDWPEYIAFDREKRWG